MSRFRVVSAAVAAICVFATAAAAMTPVSLVVTPSAVHRGYIVRVHGNAGDCPVGDAVTIISRAFVHTHEFAGVSAVFAKVRSGGAFSVKTMIPRKRHPGRYNVTARCGGGNLGVLAHLKVLA